MYKAAPRHLSGVPNNTVRSVRVRESFLQLTAGSHRGRESLFMGYNETRDVGTLTINFISDCDNDVTLLYLPTATGRPSTPLIKPPPSRWMHKFLALHTKCKFRNARTHKHTSSYPIIFTYKQSGASLSYFNKNLDAVALVCFMVSREFTLWWGVQIFSAWTA